jgi:CubicO group peptidase (beta-lactamase class C family)
MQWIVLWICFASIFTVSCDDRRKPGPGHEEPVEQDSVTTLADTYFRKLTSMDQFNGVVLLRKDGEIVLRKAYNMGRDTTSTFFVTPESQFDLRSVAKLFARVAVLRMEAEGILNREDPIGKYLPDFPNGDRITLQHLLDHTSGLPREFNDSITHTLGLLPDSVVALAAREPLEFEPGIREQYSNVWFQLLYYLIGDLSGSTFSGYLQETIFNPLGMSNSGWNFDPEPGKRPHYAYGHYRDGQDSLRPVENFPPDELRMGNLYSTVDDLDTFLASLDPVVHRELFEDRRISHAGGTRGKRAYVERGFAPDYTLIFLANYDDIPFEQLVGDLRRILTGQPVDLPAPVERKAIALAPELLRQYVGTYDFVEAGHLLLTLKLESDSLRVYQKGQYNGVLYPENQRVFFGDPHSRESLEFVPDGEGGFFILMDFQGVQWRGVKVGE